MATWLKQSTAVDVAVGPFLDETDGKTIEDGLTITQPDVRLKKNGGNWGQKSAAQTLSHEEAGWYEVNLSTTDTDTLGILIVAIHESGALPVWREFMVVAANIYDSFIGGGDVLDVSVTQWLGTAAATPTVNGVPEVDITHVAGATTDVSALATNVAAILVDTGTTLQGELDGIQADTEDIQAKIGTPADTLAADILVIDNFLDTEVAAILADTNELQTDWADGGRLDLILDARASQTSVNTIDDFLDTEVAAILAAVDTEVGAILTDTTALNDTARSEPGTGAPAESATTATKVDYLYKAWRNKTEQTDADYNLYNDDGSTIGQNATCSDDATTFTRGEVGTGA